MSGISVFIVVIVTLLFHLEAIECGAAMKRSLQTSSDSSLSSCGIQYTNGHRFQRSISRIFGGVRAELGEFPWLAMIFYSKTEKHECGGAVISSQFVLTAAHCLTGVILNIAGQP